MAIKKQKRTINEVNSAQPKNGSADKKLSKFPKKMNCEKPDSSEGPSKKKLIKIEKPQVAIVESKKVKAPESKNDEKRAKLLQMRENRKKMRKNHGQYSLKTDMSVDFIKKRIEIIKARPELSKTAKRKLGVLVKKLAIIEGTYVPKAKPEKSQTKRRNKNNKKSAEPVAKTEDSKKKIGTSKSLVSAPVVKLEKGTENKKKSQSEKKANKMIMKKEEPEESDEDDDDNDEEEVDEKEEEEETDDEEVDDSDEEDEDSKVGILNSSKEDSAGEVEDDDDDDDDDEEEDDDDDEEDDDDEDEDDDDDDDDDEDEEEIKYAIPADKLKEEIKKNPLINKEILKKGKEPAANGDGEKKKRFVLFVGNLSFQATADDIKKHFLTKVSEVLNVRIPTKPGTNAPRGIAYVELSNETDYQKGLSLHNTNVNGRRINVEYTKPGAKFGDNRSEIVSKNKKLHAMRKGGMLAGKRDDRNDRRRKQKKET